MTVAVVIPFAGTNFDRLDHTMASAWLAAPTCVLVSLDRHYKGVAWAMNDGRRRLGNSVTHLARLDCGDTYSHDRFDVELPSDRGLFSRCFVESRDEYYPNPNWEKRIFSDNQFQASSTVVPLKVWDAVGGYDESLRYCSDWDFHMRVQAYCGWEYDDRHVVTANEYPGGLTLGSCIRERNRDRARVHARALELKR